MNRDKNINTGFGIIADLSLEEQTKMCIARLPEDLLDVYLDFSDKVHDVRWCYNSVLRAIYKYENNKWIKISD